MFEEIDLSSYDNQSNVKKQKSKNKGKNKQMNSMTFILDKFDNLVYKDGIYYGTYKAESNNKENNHNDHDTVPIEIFNSCQEHKYTIHKHEKSYEEICDVFDQYQSIIMEEHVALMDEIDQDLEVLFKMMEHKIEVNSREHTSIRNKLKHIVEKMYNSKIDLTTESYDKIDNFMKKLDGECV